MTKSGRKAIYMFVIAAGFVCLFFAAKTNSYGMDFREAHNERYTLIPDNGTAWYELYENNEDDKTLVGYVDFYSPLILQDDVGNKTLMVRFLDTGAFIPVMIDHELQSLLDQTIGKDVRYGEPDTYYEIRHDKASGLEYIVEKSMPVAFGHVLLDSSDDILTYTNIADRYADSYDIVMDRSVGYIYADLEVKGHARRYENGFFFYQPGNINYIDEKNAKDSWSLTLTYDEYMSLSTYLCDETMDFDLRSYENWKEIFDITGVEYDIMPDVNSRRYQAAKEDLTRMWGSFPAENMSAEMAEHNLINHMKHFDEYGNELNFYGIAGMNIVELPVSEKNVIIDVPEETLRAIYDYEKDALQSWYGIYINADKKSEILFDYQKETPIKDRLSGTYTLEEYDRIFYRLFVSAIKEYDADWNIGDPFDTKILDQVTFDYAMSRIRSDGDGLRIIMDPDISDILDDTFSRVFSSQDLKVPNL